jgi:CBS domain-containing protein
MSEFKILNTVSLQKIKSLGVDEAIEPLTMQSPATYVMTDFTRRSPNLIQTGTTVDQAILVMRKSLVKSKIVVDEHLKLVGIVSLTDLLSRKVLMTANNKGILRQDLSVEDVMVSRDKLHAVDYQKLSSASIGDILTTMRKLGENHLLVVDGEHTMRGLVSAGDISRALHIAVNINSTAHSFKDVFDVIHDHRELS